MYEISQVERPTQPADVQTLPGVAELDAIENRVQQAAETVAERHVSNRSPEWVEFVLDRIDGALLAALLKGGDAAKPALEPLQREFTEWLVDIYFDAGGRGVGSLYNEVRREV